MILKRHIFLTLIILFSVLVGETKTLQNFSYSNPDTTIFYYGDIINFNNLEKKIYLTENARLKYKNISFEA